MADLAHTLTDEELDALERRIKTAYKRASASIQKRADKFFNDFKTDADKLYKAIDDAKDATAKATATKAYKDFLTRKTTQGKNITDLRDKIASDLLKVNQLTAAEIGDRMNGVFALNHNFAAYSLEKELGLNLLFTAYDERVFDEWVKSKKSRISKPKVNTVKDIRWNKQLVASSIAKGVAIGMTVDEMSKSVTEVADKNKNASLIAAATFILAAATSGKTDAHEYAQEIGIDMEKEWVSTLDEKTREAHRDLDGQRVDLDEPFKIDGVEIMEPRDENAPAYLIYNCRCELAYHVKGVSGLDPKYRADNIDKVPIEDITYRQWEELRRGKGDD